MTAGIRLGYAQTPRGPLHYAEAGDGPPLLLLHATPRSHRAFRHLLPLLAPHFRAIAIDAPGFGNSYRLPGRVEIYWFAEALAQFLDALGLERAHVFGLHTGNKIAAAFAEGWPDRIGRFVFAGQTHSIIIEGKEREREIRAFCDRFFPRYGESTDGVHHLRDWVATHAVVEGHWWPQHLLNGATVTAEDVAASEVRVLDHMQGWRSIVPIYEAILSFDLPAALRAVRAPTLVLELLASNEAHLTRQAERICALMPQAVPGHVQDADGLTPERQPDAVADAILPFLRAEA
jgi:pimeloyl-ACP methyl ester carboxylesterase